MNLSSANFTAWFRLKGKSSKTFDITVYTKIYVFFLNFNLGGAAAQQLPPWMCPCAASIPYPEDRSSSSCNFVTLIRPIYITKARTPVSKEDNRLGQPPQLVDLGLLRYSIIGPPFPIIISESTPGSQKRVPEHRLLWGGQNPFRNNPQRTTVFCQFWYPMMCSRRWTDLRCKWLCHYISVRML